MPKTLIHDFGYALRLIVSLAFGVLIYAMLNHFLPSLLAAFIASVIVVEGFMSILVFEAIIKKPY
jgi:uncharacterized protein YqhQ